ncbi:hypothetical protein D0B54_01530 [Solimonas sp. K1W22B-7]|uniref:hypothetical protein n=1 Tax=Solimonas sp. K1W22B-7 TaxID=2303331 RepID=UPI000E32E013|nr:hypothetical protein [Solimonas sp. K1W22B-7]AXQ27444.1 hypothetical protein D0B54_01530 [Solimonas sp. K1W22B-7]
MASVVRCRSCNTLYSDTHAHGYEIDNGPPPGSLPPLKKWAGLAFLGVIVIAVLAGRDRPDSLSVGPPTRIDMAAGSASSPAESARSDSPRLAGPSNQERARMYAKAQAQTRTARSAEQIEHFLSFVERQLAEVEQMEGMSLVEARGMSGSFHSTLQYWSTNRFDATPCLDRLHSTVYRGLERAAYGIRAVASDSPDADTPVSEDPASSAAVDTALDALRQARDAAAACRNGN